MKWNGVLHSFIVFLILGLGVHLEWLARQLCWSWLCIFTYLGVSWLPADLGWSRLPLAGMTGAVWFCFTCLLFSSRHKSQGDGKGTRKQVPMYKIISSLCITFAKFHRTKVECTFPQWSMYKIISSLCVISSKFYGTKVFTRLSPVSKSGAGYPYP